MPDLLIDAPPADAASREAALDIRRSVIVQAPAGSGKTDLLTRRFLRLLAAVDEPEEILAITFTRAATAEMRSRILSDLEIAAGLRSASKDDADRIPLARAALAHAERRGWNLLRQPQRLLIETIDSLCLRIAHGHPLLARLGGRYQPTEDAEILYASAARRTLAHLGGADASLSEALAHLLDLRDNRLSGCESLIAKMLETRDQWQETFPLSRAMNEDDWDVARTRLEAPFRREVNRVLANAHQLLSAQALLAEQLFTLANFACEYGNEKIAPLAGIPALSPALSLEHWQCICDFLLTQDNAWRRSVNRNHGFPSSAASPEARRRKEAMLELLAHLRQIPNLLPALCAIRELPPSAYTEEQWTTLRHIFTVLRHATAELRVVFAEHNVVDFIEVSLAALEVLEQNPDSLAPLGSNLRHLLVDEFQDTSRRQHRLVHQIVDAWDREEHRSYFLVGDPMQSIYMFRQAEVELFHHVRDHGLGHIPCDSVQLSVNFRSHTGLTTPINGIFSAICAQTPPPGSAAVPFTPSASSSTCSPLAVPPNSVHIHPRLIGTPENRPTLEEVSEARQQEAQAMLRIIAGHLPRIEDARSRGTEYRVAVLVRARSHLAELIPLLRNNGIPFRAVEIEHLSDRQELLDLLSLTRALLHPMDRIAWLAVLRAPWCGLTLSDLHRLTGSDDRAFRKASVLDLIDRHQHLLSTDGRRRLARTAEILRQALAMRWRQSESPSFSSWIERTWRTLGGPGCIDAAALENAQVFFSLLDGLTPDGMTASTSSFALEFDRLFAEPDPTVSERCGVQLMTIHKAKGLGFEVVIVPGLDRNSSSDSNPLICSLERVSSSKPGENEFLVAPIGAQGDETQPLYKWVRNRRKIRFDEERKRLFYVACTRARLELHLLGTAVLNATGIRVRNNDSLLATAWPALRADFEALPQLPSGPPLEIPAAPDGFLPFPEPPVLLELAAVAETRPPLLLRRLPSGFDPLPSAHNVPAASALSSAAPVEFRRPQGSRQARLIGSAVHALLQRLGSELSAMDASGIRTRAASLLRASALSGETLASAAESVTALLLACAADPICQWILAPHPEAQSEVSWTGWTEGEGAALRTLRADRIFRAGPAPLTGSPDSSEYLWVIDYKTGAVPSGSHQAFLAVERALYSPQLLAYANALRVLHGANLPLRLGLYYPAITTLDYWDPS